MVVSAKISRKYSGGVLRGSIPARKGPGKVPRSGSLNELEKNRQGRAGGEGSKLLEIKEGEDRRRGVVKW